MNADIKQIAKNIAEEFPKAVLQAERNDAADIASVLQDLDQQYDIFAKKMEECKVKRDEHLTALAWVFDEEHTATELYRDNVKLLRERLDMMRKLKLGQGEPR